MSSGFGVEDSASASHTLPASRRVCCFPIKRVYTKPSAAPASSLKLSAFTRRSLVTYSIATAETRWRLRQLVPAIPNQEFEAERNLFRALTQERTSMLRAEQLAAALTEYNDIDPALCDQILTIFEDSKGAPQPLSLAEFCVASACCRLQTIVEVPRALSAWQHTLSTHKMPTPPFLCHEPSERHSGASSLECC
mmetsp:Transcript_10970/g.23425  ORF Transcript_10970/g.23425 Transcript_10970/m.23425 type:complete len:194 (-) Transcript_10970:402-983(-)